MQFKNILLTIVGILLLLLGIFLVFTPFPGILLIIAGLACLSQVYERPKALLLWSQKRLQTAARSIDKKRIRRKLYR